VALRPLFAFARDFTYANLAGFRSACKNMREANFCDANLDGATIGFADARGAIFSKANLTGATLEQCDLRDAYLTGARRDRTTVIDVRTDAATDGKWW
jgi:uncharacterized protein YjbI with pentapeptide repeats